MLIMDLARAFGPFWATDRPSLARRMNMYKNARVLNLYYLCRDRLPRSVKKCRPGLLLPVIKLTEGLGFLRTIRKSQRTSEGKVVIILKDCCDHTE